jgi:putative flippase GtrA
LWLKNSYEFLKKESSKQFIKFSIIGVLNTIINLAVLYVCTDIFGIYYLISAIIAFMAAVTNSFVLNKTWTFNEKINQNAYSKYAKFFIISIIALAVNLVILYVLVEFFSIHYIIAQLIGIISNLIINFFGNKLWTFKKK